MNAKQISQPLGPHGALAARDAAEQFCCKLFDRLWDRYRQRVSYAAAYEQVVTQAGATFVNDHIAFRTFASQHPTTGIVSLSRIFEALGYRAAGCYHFPDKCLSAIHFQHANPRFPKLFISELQLWQLPAEPRRLILNAVASHRPLPDDGLLASLAGVSGNGGSGNSGSGNSGSGNSGSGNGGVGDRVAGTGISSGQQAAADDEQRRAELLDRVVGYFEQLPWDLPSREDVEALNRHSQYAAWVLVHGYNVNHFTSLINSHQVASLNDIDKTVAALRSAGVPMKPDIEGQPGSKLRQTATEAVVIDVAVRDCGKAGQMPWTYAYFELAERGDVRDAETGQSCRFEGFLGPQATNLFEMTRRTDS
jgi:hypothetical protein